MARPVGLIELIILEAMGTALQTVCLIQSTKFASHAF